VPLRVKPVGQGAIVGLGVGEGEGLGVGLGGIVQVVFVIPEQLGAARRRKIH
jgi:hypothetical protein